MKSQTQGIQYVGSKLKMLPIIAQSILPLRGVHSVLDGFSGTTRVSQMLAQMGYCVWSNDVGVWSGVFAECYLKSEKPDAYYQKIIDMLNALKPTDGWFCQNYGGLDSDEKRPFQMKNMQKLDAIRTQIDALDLSFTDKCVLLTSLIEALDKVNSTLGHYAAYLKKWSRRSYKDLFLELPVRSPLQKTHTVTCQNVFDILPQHTFDLAYFDPPYGSNNNKMPSSRVRYNAYYHFLKTVVLNDKPELFGKNARRMDSKDSQDKNPFEDYHQGVAPAALYRLIEQTRAPYIMLSYSSSGRISKKEITEILSAQGTILKSLACDFKHNNMANLTSTNEWVNADKGHQEYLFLLQKTTYK